MTHKFKDFYVSEHFRLSEFLNSKSYPEKTAYFKRYPIDVSVVLLSKIFLMASVLEHLRHLIGDCPIRINSGYRPAALNSAVGGSRNSHHLDCCAVDIACDDIDLLKDKVKLFADSDSGNPIVKEVIYHDTYVHLAFNLPDAPLEFIINSNKI